MKRTQISLSVREESGLPLAPGSGIRAIVRITTNVQIELRQLILLLKTKGICVLNKYRTQASGRRLVSSQTVLEETYLEQLCYPLLNDEYSNMGDIHLGLGKDKSSSQEVSNGVTLPSGLPDTWSAAKMVATGRVATTLCAQVVYIRKCGLQKQVDIDGNEVLNSVNAEVELNIRNPVAVEDFCRHGEVESSKIVRSLDPRGPRNKIRCRLTLLDQAAVLGQKLPMEIRIFNGMNKRMKKVTLALYKVYILRDSDPWRQPAKEAFIVKKLKKVALASVSSYSCWEKFIKDFTIPEDCGTSGSLNKCTFARVRFFLRLKMKWRPLGWQNCDQEIYIGEHRKQDFECARSMLDVHELQ